MNAKLKVENPENIEFTLTMTMTLRDWEQLSRQLNNSYPSWKLSEVIGTMTHRARQTFSSETYSGNQSANTENR